MTIIHRRRRRIRSPSRVTSADVTVTGGRAGGQRRDRLRGELVAGVDGRGVLLEVRLDLVDALVLGENAQQWAELEPPLVLRDSVPASQQQQHE